jgi:hypothetical protein
VVAEQAATLEALHPAPWTIPETIWRTWPISRRIPETRDVITLVMEYSDRAVQPSHPDQYIAINQLTS